MFWFSDWKAQQSVLFICAFDNDIPIIVLNEHTINELVKARSCKETGFYAQANKDYRKIC